MSLIIATPCRDGVVLASDSRALIGPAGDQLLTDVEPKLLVRGSFGVATTGVLWSGTTFNPRGIVTQFWQNGAVPLTERALDALRSRLVDHVRNEWDASWEVDLGGTEAVFAMLACFASEGEARIGFIRIPFNALDESVVEEHVYSPESPVAVHVVGRQVPPARVPYVLVRDVRASQAVGLVNNILLERSAEDRFVGGSLCTALLRPQFCAAVTEERTPANAR